MKVSVKKILGVAAFALAATFFAGTFASCDTGTNPGTNQSSDDDELADDPASEVKWEFADEGTVTRIAVELDENIIGEKDTAITTWESYKFYGWADKSGLNTIYPLGGWGGTKAQVIEAEGKKTIIYVNIPAESTPKTEAINIIVNTGDTDQISLGSIKAGEQKIYKITGEGEEAKAALVDWAEEDQEGTVAEGEEPEPEKTTGKYKFGVTADYYDIKSGDKIYVWYWGDHSSEAAGKTYPGDELVLNETLGIYIFEVEVEGEEDSAITVKINKGGDAALYQGSLKLNQTKLFTHAGTWIDWDGESADTTEPAEPPAPPAPTGADSTIIAVDVSKVTVDGAAVSWTAVGIYTFSKELFGGWPGLTLIQSDEYPNIFYADVTGKEGSGTSIVFNKNGDSSRNEGAALTTEAGKKYIYSTADGWKEWEDFTVDVLNAPPAPITAESTLIAIDVSTDPQGKATGWTNADVADTSENKIFGDKKVILTKSTSNANIWYADITGKEGTAQLVFSNTKSATRETNAAVTIEAGKKYIYKAGDVVEWEDFTLAVINAEDKEAEETEPAVTPDTGDDGDDTTGENPDEGVPPEDLNPPEDDETDPTTVPGDGE